MQHIRDILLLFSLLLAFFGAGAQTREIRIRAYGFEDGLSHRNVFKIGQDTAGYLWLGTAQGLNRFDGHDFLAWTTDNTRYHLPCDNITDICFDENNRLWLACSPTSENTGLILFDPSRNKADTIPLAGNSTVRNQERRLGNLLKGSKNKLWVTTYLNKDKSTWLQGTDDEGVLQDVVQLPGQYTGRPLEQANGLIYAGAFENEIWAFDQHGRQLEQFEFPAPRQDKSFSRVKQLQTTRNGTLWALLDHGQIYSLPAGSSAFTRHPLSDLAIDNIRSSAFLVEENGDIWLTGLVASQNNNGESPCSSIQPGASLLHYDATSGTLEDFSYYLKQVMPYAEPPRQIFRDRTGVIWIASEFGLIQLVESDLFVRYLSDGNDCCRNGVCSIRGITGDDEGNIYFSYYSSIHVLNPKTNSLMPFFSRQIGFPFGILYHDSGLWTGEGLRIDLKTQEIDTIIPDAAGHEGVVIADREGPLWFGCRRGLCYFNPRTKTVHDFVDPSGNFPTTDFKNITYLFQGTDASVIWVATQEKGVFKINKQNGVLHHYHMQSTPALPNDRILVLAETRGDIWIGTPNGLCRLNIENNQLKIYTTENGLPNQFINGMLTEGDSVVWLSTDNRLSRLDVRSEQFTNFYESDGLSKNEFNRISFYRARDGRMYFGGLNGVNAFYPGNRYGQQQDKMNSRLLVTEFSKFDGEQDHRQTWGLANHQTIELSYRDEMFTFWFSLADFADPKMHLYRYRLEGYDKEWSKPSPVNFARYFNIPAGRYTMQVQASRGGGDWASDELNIPLIIHEAFYKTKWFQILALMALATVFYGIMRYRLHRLEEHEKELESLVQKRTQELETEKHKSEELLLNILPAETAEELKQHGAAKARRFEETTVLFSDFKGFSLIAGEMEPEALVAEIHFCFRAFDEIMEVYDLEKIKTVGDAYLCAGGIGGEGSPSATAVRVVKAALEIQAFLQGVALERKDLDIPFFEARIGIHSGPVIAGIVGIKKFAYDIWGDTVNIAERLQSNGAVGKVNISRTTYDLVKDHFVCTYRGVIEAKHGQQVEMFFVEGLKKTETDKKL